MRVPSRARLWRFLSLSAAPFLTILAVLLLRREDRAAQLLGAVAGLVAVVALVGPLVARRRR